MNELQSSATESNSNYSSYSTNQGKVNKLAQLRQQKLDNLRALREGVIYEEHSRVSQNLEKSGSQTEMVNSSGDFMTENLADLEKKFLSKKLKQYIFCYNECANRHWSWSKLPLDQVRFQITFCFSFLFDRAKQQNVVRLFGFFSRKGKVRAKRI